MPQTHPGRMADTPLEPGRGTSCKLRTSLSPTARRRQPAPFRHSPWRSGLQSFPGGLTWPVWLGICCQHGQVLAGAPAAGRQLPAHSSQASGLLFGLCHACPGRLWITSLSQHGSWDGLPRPGPRTSYQDPGEWSLRSETLEKETAAQAISDGMPMAIQTVNCAKIFHVERLLGSRPMS